MTNETLYEDKSTRDSIRQPYILVKEKKRAESTYPVHFFEDPKGTSTIKMGSAYRNNSCDVCLNALNAKGHAMNWFGLSNEAMSITYDGDTEVLQLTSTNSGKLVFYQSHTGNSWQINPGQTIDLGDGDEVRFADNKYGSPAYSVIRFVHPLWTLDLPPEVKKARDEAAGAIDSQIQEEKRCLEEQQRRTQEKHDAAIATLEGKRDSIMKCESVEAVAKLMSTPLTGSKRKATEELPTPRTIKSRSSNLEKEAERQKLQNFRKAHQQAISAKQFLSRRPANAGSKWNKQAQQHRQVLAQASRLECYYYAHGTCRDGDDCLFRHDTAARGEQAVLIKWKPSTPETTTGCGFGFAKLKATDERVYVPGSILMRDVGINNIRQGMNLEILQMDDAPFEGGSRVATRVEG